MPRRGDLRSVLVLGPAAFGGTAEFDHIGTQACRVFRAEGLRLVVVNSNPATAMTDPDLADATYVEPVTPETVEMVIAGERPDAVVPTFGGPTALGTAVALHESGTLARYGVELLGVNLDAVQAAGDFTSDAPSVVTGVDALYDGRELYVGGVVEHVETSCVLPPITLGRADLARLRSSTRRLADSLGVRGLINVRYAVASGVPNVLEVAPRAGRTVPFVSKATGVALASAAARLVLGFSIAELRAEGLLPATGDGGTPVDSIAVREEVFGSHALRAGEVMGVGASFGTAYAKARAAAASPLPTKGRVFVSVANRDRRAMILPVKALADAGFEVLSTSPTAEVLNRNGISTTEVPAPTVTDRILSGEIDLVITTAGPPDVLTAALTQGVPCATTVQGLTAAVLGIEATRRGAPVVTSLQQHAAGQPGHGAEMASRPGAAPPCQYEPGSSA